MANEVAQAEIRKNPLVSLIWILPLLVAAAVVVATISYFKTRGAEITIQFSDAMGIMPKETRMLYRGAEIGRVQEIALSEDQKSAEVKVRLTKNAERFSTAGASFWIVRPEVSQSGLSGLGTILTGPYIQAVPGAGKEEKDLFEGYLASLEK